MLRTLVFGLAFIGSFAHAYSDSLSPWFGGEGQEAFQVPVTESAAEPATQISDISNTISAIETSTNFTDCLPEGCPKGTNTAKTTVMTVKASQF